MKPLVYNINAFDARYEKTIEFEWQGNQAFKNKCIIRNNATNTIVYQSIQETFQLKHVIPAHILTNGILYNITISVYDINGTESETSDPVLFYCYTKPTFEFTNLIDNQVIRNSSYNVILNYYQPEGEELQSYQLHLYNTNKNLIWSSGVRYDTSNLSISMYDLDDNGTYYVRATGITVNGMELDTGYVFISVNYEMPSVYALLTLENIKKEGSVKIQSNIISLEGKYVGSGDPVYIDNEYIDLTDNKVYVYFDEGFLIDKDFTLNIIGYNMSFSTILILSNGEKTIILSKEKCTFASDDGSERVYFKLKVPSAFTDYIIHSQYIIPPLDTDLLSIWIKRKNNIYSVYIKNLSS